MGNGQLLQQVSEALASKMLLAVGPNAAVTGLGGPFHSQQGDVEASAAAQLDCKAIFGLLLHNFFHPGFRFAHVASNKQISHQKLIATPKVNHEQESDA